MDDETISVLKTVCVAGRARSGFNEQSNAQLDQLVQAGLLDVVQAVGADPRTRIPRRYYQPTEKGKAMYRQLSSKGAA
jgi:hypothetical protein